MASFHLLVLSPWLQAMNLLFRYAEVDGVVIGTLVRHNAWRTDMVFFRVSRDIPDKGNESEQPSTDRQNPSF